MCILHFIPVAGCILIALLYPLDSIRWILWNTHVQRFSRYPSRGQGIKGRLLKYTRYIDNHKILPVNIFGLILKNKMAAMGFSFFGKEFCWPSRAKGIIGGDLQFPGYIHHYKILTGNIFGLILKNKMAATWLTFLFSHEKCLYLPYH